MTLKPYMLLVSSTMVKHALITIRVSSDEQDATYAGNRALPDPDPTHVKHPTNIFRINIWLEWLYI